MEGLSQVPGIGLDISALLKQIQDGTEAEGLLRVTEKVMDRLKDNIFAALSKKQPSDNLHNLNSVCVALGYIHDELQARIDNKKIAQTELKKREEE